MRARGRFGITRLLDGGSFKHSPRGLSRKISQIYEIFHTLGFPLQGGAAIAVVPLIASTGSRKENSAMIRPALVGKRLVL